MKYPFYNEYLQKLFNAEFLQDFSMISFPQRYDEYPEYHVVKSIIHHTRDLDLQKKQALFLWVANEAASSFCKLKRDEQILRLELLKELKARDTKLLDTLTDWLDDLVRKIDQLTCKSAGELYRAILADSINHSDELRSAVRKITLDSPHASWLVAPLMAKDREWFEKNKEMILVTHPNLKELIEKIEQRDKR